MSINDAQCVFSGDGEYVRGVAIRFSVHVYDTSGLRVTGGLSGLAIEMSQDGGTVSDETSDVSLTELSTNSSIVVADVPASHTDNSRIDGWITSTTTDTADIPFKLNARDVVVVSSGTFGDQTGLNSNEVKLASGEDDRDQIYEGLLLKVTSGSGDGHARWITDYVGSTKVATLRDDPQAAVTGSDTYEILAVFPASGVRIADPGLAEKDVHGVILDKTAIVTVATQTSYDLAAGDTLADLYNEHVALFFGSDGTFAGFGVISDYQPTGGQSGEPKITLESSDYLRETITTSHKVMIVRNNFLSETMLESVEKEALKAVNPPFRHNYIAAVVSATSATQFVVSISDIDGNAVDASTLGNLKGAGILVHAVEPGSNIKVGEKGQIQSTSYSSPNLSVTLETGDALSGTPVQGDVLYISAF